MQSCRRSTVKFVRLLFISVATAFVAAAAEITYWIEPCAATAASCEAGDADLARWAFAAWERASGGELTLTEIKDRSKALIRVRWADRNSGLYGEAVPILVNGRRGSELHILIEDVPGADGKPDRLMRDTVVYLTCLHESGHALGLNHTQAFADIMYSFQYGGDIAEYFGRYRRRLIRREDIQRYPGMSAADIEALMRALRVPVANSQSKKL